MFDDEKEPQSRGGYQWQKERRRPGTMRIPTSPVRGFGPAGGMTLWLVLPLTRKTRIPGQAGDLIDSFDFTPQKDLHFDALDRDLQDQISRAVQVDGSRVSVPQDLLFDYACSVIGKTYNCTLPDLRWLLPTTPGAKWIVPVLQHALGGEAVCIVAGKFPAGGVLSALDTELQRRRAAGA